MALPFMIMSAAARRGSSPIPLLSSGAVHRYGYGVDPAQRALSATLSLAIAGGVAAVLMLALVAPEVGRTISDPFIGTEIKIDPPEPKPVDDPLPKPPTVTRTTSVTTVKPIVDVRPIWDTFSGTDIDVPDIDIPGGLVGGGNGTFGTIVDRPSPPAFIVARRDPAFAARFQPPYPAAMQREEIEGEARVRITIAANGRVTAIEDLGSSNPAFFAATRRQALAHWRYVPATRGGVPVESTQELTVRFIIPEG